MSNTPSNNNAYDEVPYDSMPFAQSSPEHISAVGHLFGLTPVAPERARVLEIGCSSGGNLLGLAQRYPQMELHGFDLSAKQIAIGQADAQALGLTNVQFRQADILNVATERQQYDYIIAHGIYSWVPPAVQQAILEICQHQLSPDGIAYISYNVYPGWKMREVVRDLMLFHTGNIKDPKFKLEQARAILEYAKDVNNKESPYGRLLASEAEVVKKAPDYYLFHDHLERFNSPCYFKDFAGKAAQQQLSYLGEANFSDMSAVRLGKELADKLQLLSNGNLIAYEQYMDLFTNRMFRQTLLVPQTASSRIQRNITPARLGNKLHYSAQLKPIPPKAGTPESPALEAGVQASPDNASEQGLAQYALVNGRVITVHHLAVKGVMDLLASRYPFTCTLDELAAASQVQDAPALPNGLDVLQSNLMNLLAQGALKISACAMDMVALADKPHGFEPARVAQARGQKLLPNSLHQVSQADPIEAYCLKFMDGTRTQAEIQALIVEEMFKGNLSVKNAGEPITDRSILEQLAAQQVPLAMRQLQRKSLLQP